ncbi:MAG: flagellar hook-basal body complex protein FliE [Proteobacteria bacterium]|nr:MAG: flagellar hook-basal body complex protein FliE [Pseudomonadota bacterium]
MSMGIEFGKMSGAGGLTEGFERLRESRDSLIKPNDIGGSSPAEGASFGDFLHKMVNEANSSQLTADKKLEEVAAGRNKDLHGAVLSMEKADVDFRMLTQVRNKVIEAYREVMRMQI